VAALDALYGEGTTTDFHAALPGKPKAEQVEAGGGVRVNVTWQDSSLLKIHCTPESVHFLTLRSEREGLYTDLCESLPALFKARGVRELTCSPAGAESGAILTRRGAWQTSPRGLRWEL
jgi:hypothetical protein